MPARAVGHHLRGNYEQAITYSYDSRATTLITDDSVAIVVPNSQFISERVTNWSRPGKLTAYVVSHVPHASDPELVRRVLLAAAARHPDVLREPVPQVEFVEAGLAGKYPVVCEALEAVHGLVLKKICALRGERLDDVLLGVREFFQ